jgi:hypothetical protein
VGVVQEPVHQREDGDGLSRIVFNYPRDIFFNSRSRGGLVQCGSVKIRQPARVRVRNRRGETERNRLW